MANPCPTPLGNRVLMTLIADPVNVGGIQLGGRRELPKRGKVLALGTSGEFPLSVGDEVIFEWFECMKLPDRDENNLNYYTISVPNIQIIIPMNDPQKLIVTGDRVLVLVDEPITKEQGGILLPETLNPRPTDATVVAVGPGINSKEGHIIPLRLNAGDRCIISRQAGIDTMVNGIKHKIIEAKDILAVLK